MESNRLFNDNIAAGYSMHNQLEAWRLQDELARFQSFGAVIPLYGIGSGETPNSIPESAASKCVSAFDSLMVEAQDQKIKRTSNERLFPKTTPKRRSVTPINSLLRSDPNYLGFDRLAELNEPNEDASLESDESQRARESAADLELADAPSPLKVFYDESEPSGEPASRTLSLHTANQDTIPKAQSLFRRIDPPHESRDHASGDVVRNQGTNTQFGSESESLLYKFADRFLDPGQTQAISERVKLHVACDNQDNEAPTIQKQNAPQETIIAFSATASPQVSPQTATGASPESEKPCISNPVVFQQEASETVVAPTPQTAHGKEKESFLTSFRWPLCYLGIMALAAGGGIIGYSVLSGETPLYNTGLAIVSAGTVGLGCASVLYASRLFYRGVNALFARPSRVSAKTNESVTVTAEPVVDSIPAVESLEQQVLQLQSTLEQLQRKAA